MFNVGPIELMVILVLALIVFGPEKLPELMRSAGHAIREFQRYSSELTSTFHETTAEFSSALDVSEVTDAVNEAVSSVNVNGTTVHEAPVYADPVAADAPVSTGDLRPISPFTAPSEYETAAAMVEPIAPFPEPPPVVMPPVEPPASVTVELAAPTATEPATLTATEPAAPIATEPAAPADPVAAPPVVAVDVAITADSPADVAIPADSRADLAAVASPADVAVVEPTTAAAIEPAAASNGVAELPRPRRPHAKPAEPAVLAEARSASESG